MTINIIQLGTPRSPGEGLRLGTVRRPPRGVRKGEYARKNFYDVWMPQLAPSAELLKEWKEIADESEFAVFERKFKREMTAPDAARLLDFLVALSHQTNLSLGCYCKDESSCHRSILRKLLQERGADIRS
ncbi:MAG: DUF488 domain-containing protein [Burkholderiaceae bacterium]